MWQKQATYNNNNNKKRTNKKEKKGKKGAKGKVHGLNAYLYNIQIRVYFRMLNIEFGDDFLSDVVTCWRMIQCYMMTVCKL